MARNIWVISDTHFGHSNIIKYCNRPFDDVDGMNETLIQNWNAVVKDEDIVYHLGDVYFKNPEVLQRLKGRKRLVLGNHDNAKDQNLQKIFQKIMVWRMFPEFGLLLTHVPVHESSLERWESETTKYNLVNIHGHIHEKASPSDLHRNVSVEQINYTPINIEDLRVK